MDIDLREKREVYERPIGEVKNSEILAPYKNSGKFKDKNIIVTGCTGGIGSILFGAYLNLGAKVCAVVRDEI